MNDALVIGPAEAAARGMTLYFSGEPCANGHVSPRRVCTRLCCECERLQRYRPRGRPKLFAAEVIGHHIREFAYVSWPDNGRVELVTDPNWLIDGQPRVVRKIGWRGCMCCKHRFFTQDLAKIRLCDPCKESRVDRTGYGFDREN